MAHIGPIKLALTVDVANVDAEAKYQLVGSAFDVASGQPYRELCRLIGDDTGILPAEDGADDLIVEGVLHVGTVVFGNGNPIDRSWTKTIAKKNFDEDNPAAPPAGRDEIRAVVTLTPIAATAVSRESDAIIDNYS